MCSSEQHKEYLSNKGWKIKESNEVVTYRVDIPDEIVSNCEKSGITFLREYLGEVVTQYLYELKELDMGLHNTNISVQIRIKSKFN